MVFNYNNMTRLHEFCREYQIGFELHVDPCISADELRFLHIPTNRFLMQLVDYGTYRSSYECQSCLIDLLTRNFFKNKENEVMGKHDDRLDVFLLRWNY